MNCKNLLASLGGTVAATAAGVLSNHLASNEFDIKDPTTAAGIGVAAGGVFFQGVMHCQDIPTHPKLTALASMCKIGFASWFGYVLSEHCDNVMSCLTEGDAGHGQIQAMVAFCLAVGVTLVEVGAQLACKRSDYDPLSTTP